MAFDLLLQGGTAGDFLVHLGVVLDQGFCVQFSVLEHIQKDRLQFLFVKGDGCAGGGTVLDLAGADPLGVEIALAVSAVLAVVGCAAAGAVQLGGQKVLEVTLALPVLHILTALL